MIDRVSRLWVVPLIAVMAHPAGSLLGVKRPSPHVLSHHGVCLGMYLALVLGAWCFHLPFEANTRRVRLWTKAQLFARVATVPGKRGA